jgi:hypothetical protein
MNRRPCGLVVRAVEEVFARAAVDPTRVTEVAVSYVQVYNEEVYDLLGGGYGGGAAAALDALDARGAVTAATPLRLVEQPGTGEVTVDGAAVIPVRGVLEVCALLAAAEHRRVVANQALNATSSRSHAVLTIHVARKSSLGVPPPTDGQGLITCLQSSTCLSLISAVVKPLYYH